MKGKKICLHTKSSATLFLLLFFLVLSFILFLVNPQNASALELTHGSTQSFSSGYIDLNRTDSPNFRQVQAMYTDPYLRVVVPVLTPVTQFHLSLSSDIPANSIFVFNVRYKVVSGQSQNFGYMEFNGLSTGSAWTLLNQSCIDLEGLNYGAPAAGSTIVYAEEVTCTYTGFTNVALSHINTLENNPIVTFKNTNTSTSSSNSDGFIYFSPVSIRQISWNGLTANDRAWLEEHMPEGSSTSDIESAIESAREDEKSEYENQQEDVDGGADDAGEEAEEATSSLIDTGRNIIETIRDTPATNCVIRIKSGAFDTGNMNLCNVPQQIRTVISTIITIPVTLAALHIAYSTVMLYLNTVRKEQE